jgi:hypothetical protein
MKTATATILTLAAAIPMGIFLSSSSQKYHLSSGPYPGDDLIQNPVMVYDQTRLIKATKAEIWPWLVQLGKGRGGWYCPSSWEKLMPSSWRATRQIEPQWQSLAIGDRVADYGLDEKEDYFDVVKLESEHALVYRSDRYGASFSWALLLHQLEPDERDRRQRTIVHLRFRGKIAAKGLKRRAIVAGGGILDHLTTWPLLMGLQERVEGRSGRTG